jgi:competence protein ComEC
MSDRPRPSGITRAVSLAAQTPPGLREELAWRAAAMRGHFKAWREEEVERRRLFNWLPVAMGLGVIAYFAADTEPHLAAPLIGMLVCIALAVIGRNSAALRLCTTAMAFVFLGLAAAIVRTASVGAPVIERMMIVPVSGFVESVEKRAGGSRIVLRPTSIGELPAQKRPALIRVTTRGSGLVAGDHVSGTARLLPPPEPARPGGYDFARDAFFRGVGAVGSFSGTQRLSPAPVEAGIGLRAAAAIDRAGNHLTDRIIATVGGQAGAVAAALVTGKRGQISEQTNEALRAAGIYHIISISGLHMVLVAGAIFWLVRAALALSAWIVLRWPVKKLAALAAMVGATAYCEFSGSDVATERSLIMTLVMLGAILVDRPALSMRNLAIAAIIVLLREPETLLGPSFQMSFGAVAALIAWAERARGGALSPPPVGLIGRMARIVKVAIIADLITTLLATAATAPFGLYHFNTANPYGLLGNALALPFISLIVMPAAVAGALLYPFGLDGIAWWAMGEGTKPLLAFSGQMAGWPQSTVKLPAYGPFSLGLFALALLWMTLWVTPLRWFGAAPLAVGLLFAAAPPRPDGHIDRDGRGLALRAEDGRLSVLGKPSAFALAQWLAADGDQRRPGDPTLTQAIRCDPSGCVLAIPGKGTVSHALTRRAVSEDCGLADLVVTPLLWRAPCKAALVDRNTLDTSGAATLTWDKGAWRIVGARNGSDGAATGDPNAAEGPSRPWLRVRRSTAPIASLTLPEPQGMPTDEADDLRDQ